MALTRAGHGSGEQLADFLSASLMDRVVPPEAGHEVVDTRGRISRRIFACPAVDSVYRVMTLSLYPEAVFSAIPQGLARWADALQPASVLTPAQN